MRRLIVILASLLMVSCSTSKFAEESKFSDFLPDYTRLTEAEVKSGGAALKWLDPELAQ